MELYLLSCMYLYGVMRDSTTVKGMGVLWRCLLDYVMLEMGNAVGCYL